MSTGPATIDLHGRLKGLSPEQRRLFVALLKKEGLDVLRMPIPKAFDSGPVPLSFAQERFWFLQQLTPDSPAYNESLVFRLDGALDRPALERALSEIWRRHEVLRIRIEGSAGALRQVAQPVPATLLPLIDLGGGPQSEREAEALRRIRADSEKAFDPAAGPLYRLALYRLADQRHILCIVLHHLVMDAFALRVLVSELSALYRAFKAREPSPLPEPTIQYADYARWEREILGAELFEDQLAYWRERLTGVPEQISLPLDRPRPRVMSFRGGSHGFTLDRDLADALTSLSNRMGVTLFTTTLAVFQLLLHRYGRDDDIVVGTTISNRGRSELEGMVGCFVGNLAMRSDLSGNPPFSELLRRVSTTVLDALAHPDLPFEMLLAALNPHRDASYTPLFQAAFSVNQGAIEELLALPGLHVDPIPIGTETTRFDLDFQLTKSGAGLSGLITYSSDIFEEATIVRLMASYRRLLEAVVADPDCPIASLEIMTPAERHRQLVEWNSTAAPYPSEACLHELFERQAAATPEAIAVHQDEDRLTYAELNRRANRIARDLEGLGVTRGAIVALCMDRRPELLAALLGILKSGAAYLPLDASFPRQRLGRILEEAKPAAVVAHSHLVGQLPERGAKLLRLEPGWTPMGPDGSDNPPARAVAADLAYVIYTSGSTGMPKGVRVPHRGVVNALVSLARQPGMDASDRMLAVTTLTFDIAVVELFLPLIVGGSVVMVDRATASDGRALLDLMERSRASVLQATPATWRMLLAAGWRGSPGLKALCGGEALDADLANALVARAQSLWNLYGPTETTIWSTCHRLTSGVPPISIGRPLANTQVYVLDSWRQPVPVGAVGEIYIGGDGVTEGYIDRPELMAERFLPDPFVAAPGARIYRTGDLGRFHDDGRLECLGRVDNQVKLRGFRIELGEIEAVLREHPTIADCAAMLRGYAAGDARLIAYVVHRPGPQATVSELRRHLRQRLPDYMIPQLFMELHALPLGPSGKVARRALPDPFGGPGGAAEAFVAPRTPMERLVASLWQEALGVERVGLHDNFLNIGGHSLLVAQVAARIEERTGLRIAIRDLVSGSLESIAAVLSRMSPGATASQPPRPVAAQHPAATAARFGMAARG